MEALKIYLPPQKFSSRFETGKEQHVNILKVF